MCIKHSLRLQSQCIDVLLDYLLIKCFSLKISLISSCLTQEYNLLVYVIACIVDN